MTFVRHQGVHRCPGDAEIVVEKALLSGATFVDRHLRQAFPGVYQQQIVQIKTRPAGLHEMSSTQHVEESLGLMTVDAEQRRGGRLIDARAYPEAKQAERMRWLCRKRLE